MESRGNLKPGTWFPLALVLAYSGILRAAVWGLLIEWLLRCKGADWNQLEINPLHLSARSSAGQTPDGAAIYISFYFALLAHRQLALSRKEGTRRLSFMRRPGRRKRLYPSPLDVKTHSRMWNWRNVQKYGVGGGRRMYYLYGSPQIDK